MTKHFKTRHPTQYKAITEGDTTVKKKGPVTFSLSTVRNMICAVLGCCGTEQDFYRRLGLETVRNLLVSVGF